LPLYEYRCRKCGTTIEKIQKFSDAPLVKCGRCGGRLERVLSAPAIQFKGTGWYVTDYARKNSSDSSKSNGGSAGKNDGAASETKKTAPTESKTK
jgi:putative FmdB family regulatory protein